MSLKDIFSQEVKNMMEKDGLSTSSNSAQSETESGDSYIEQRAAQERAQAARAAAEQQAHAQQNAERSTRTEEPVSQSRPAPAPAKPFVPNYTPSSDDGEETTIISRNTVIEGNIRSFANVNVEGSIKGDVQITKDAYLSGKLVGNLECNNCAMIGSQMQGNVNSKGEVKFNKDSLILGNLTAQYLDMNGKVKGNIEISGKAEFKSDSYILGDITVASLTVLDGATINGHVRTTFLADNQQQIFPEMIALAE